MSPVTCCGNWRANSTAAGRQSCPRFVQGGFAPGRPHRQITELAAEMDSMISWSHAGGVRAVMRAPGCVGDGTPVIDVERR
jgi:hypothetical protein